MLLRFTKTHGPGNDFMVLDLVSQRAHVQPEHVEFWGNRSTGIGSDQLLIVEAPSSPDVDFCYRIFDADGSEVEQRGNGACCFVHFAQDKRLTVKKSTRVETKGGIIELNICPDGQVTVDMGPSRLAPTEIPFQAECEALSYEIEVDGQRVELAVVSMGNPHGMLCVENADSAPIHSLGPQLGVHPRLPKKTDIGFPQVFDSHYVYLRVWERGVGETQACGTGACAVAAAGIRQGWLQSPVQIDLPDGRLHIEWAGPGQSVMMIGFAVRVYEGQVRLQGPSSTRTETLMTEKNQEPTVVLDAEQVIAYLSQHPEFFVEHDEPIPELRIPHQLGDAVSLVERQVRPLRERNIEACHWLS